MAESRVPTIEERNEALFEELNKMPVGHQEIYYSEECNIRERLAAIKNKYNVNKYSEEQFPFALTLCTGALIVVKLREVT